MLLLLQLKVPVGKINCLPVTLLTNTGLQSIAWQQRHRLLGLSVHLLMDMLLLLSHLSILTHFLFFELYAFFMIGVQGLVVSSGNIGSFPQLPDSEGKALSQLS